MRIAFYAPMKPPDHPVPSGDRTMARLLVRALEQAGHEVRLACRLQSRDPKGNPARQVRLRDLGARMAAGYARRCARDGWRPELWFTYHLYYKAPDWLGPAAARALGIPYLVAEASVAHKRAGGPWDTSYRAVLAALDQAAAIVPLNPKNAACLPHPERHRELPPFLEIPAEPSDEDQTPLDLCRPGQNDPPALIAVGMMRAGAKLASYRLLAEALDRLTDRDWTLDLVGFGPAEPEVRAAFARFGRRVHWHGWLEPNMLLARLRAADLFVWPAVEEAYGMAILEAMAAGLPVVAGDEGGVSALVADGETGFLAAPRNVESFADGLARLLDDAALRRRFGRAGRAKAEAEHSLAAASATLDALVRECAGR
jgi:glycosyltransferase involved in cell wall biosynthesis